MPFDGEERRQNCEQGSCTAADLVGKIEALSRQVEHLSEKVEALDSIFKKIEDIERGFSWLRKIVVGVGTGIMAIYGAYGFIKDHWKP